MIDPFNPITGALNAMDIVAKKDLRKNQMTPKRKQVTFNLDLETHTRVKICAARQDVTMNLFIHVAILQALREQELDLEKKESLR